ncbi:MAG: bacillolysin family protein, partial [Verrucomicrobiales bacterium]|nr:bacillolysin family protein [Verrucomicrobiales bacterium]
MTSQTLVSFHRRKRNHPWRFLSLAFVFCSLLLALTVASSTGRCDQPPTITQQPVSVVANTGDNVEFTVVTDEVTDDLIYQWYRNGVAMSWRTEATLTLPQVTTFDTATYTATVANSAGSVTSTGATLTVNCGSLQNGNFEDGLNHWFTPWPGYDVVRNSPRTPPEGQYYAELGFSGIEGVRGTIQQTVCVTPGNWYKLAFQYGSSLDPNYPEHIGNFTLMVVEVLSSGGVVASQEYTRTSPYVGFAPENLEFQAPSGVSMVTLSFRNLSAGDNPMGDPLLDDISFNAITPPTPPTITQQPA